jgi:biopolymer transport protein ExbD
MPGYCLNSWQTGTPDWTASCIWHSSDYIERAIFVCFALMLAYNVLVVGWFIRRYLRYRRENLVLTADSSSTSQQNEKKSVADLSRGLGTLKVIASVAPFLGLAGTSYGILSALYFDYSGSRAQLVELIFARVGAALTTTVAGIIIAIPAIISYNLLRTRTEDILPARSFSKATPGTSVSGSLRFAQMLPLKKRFSCMPPFALIAAPALACVVGLFMTFEPYETPTGLSVTLPPDHCRPGLVEPPIVLRVTNNGKLFLNVEPEDWNQLAKRILEIYATRSDRVLYLQADNQVPFQTIADAIDLARSSPAGGAIDITVRLITPRTQLENPLCHEPVWTGTVPRR